MSNRRLFASLTFGAQLGALTGAIALIAAATVGLAAAYVARLQTIELIEAGLGSVAGTMATRMAQVIGNRVAETEFLSELEGVMTASSTPQTLGPMLNLVKGRSPSLLWIGFADTNGTVIAASGGHLEGASIRNAPWFENGLNGTYVEDVRRAPQLLGAANSETVASDPAFFHVAAPVYGQEGRLEGVLGVKVNWDMARSLRDSTLAADGRPDVELFVLRRDGTALLSGEVGETVLSREEADLAYRTGRGTLHRPEFLMSYAVMRGREGAQLGWIVVAQQPVASALAPLNQLTWTIVAIGGSISLAGWFAALFVARRLSLPLQELAREADEIGRDPDKSNLRHQQGAAEIAQLSASLRSLLRRVTVEKTERLEIEKIAVQETGRLEATNRELRELANQDFLTGLLNRRSFMKSADDALAFARRYKRPLAVLVIDVDHFKSVNDTLGHGAGDAVLRHVADAIASAVRDTDSAGRLGGEEFAVLAREADATGAETLAERIRKNVQETVELPDGRSVTVSVGGALVLPADEDIEAAIVRADRQLYQAKGSGRNCVAFDPVESAPA